MDYIFQTRQQLRFQVFDEDEGNNDQLIGVVSTPLGAIVGAKSQTLLLDLKNGKSNKKPGKLILRLQPCQSCNKLINMKWKARKLLNTDSFFDFWDKSDPYLKFLKIRKDNSYIQAGRTQVIMNNLSPSWKSIQIPKNRIFYQNNQGMSDQQYSEKFKIQCWDWQQQGQYKHQFIGQTLIDLKQIKNFPVQFPLKNMRHKNPGTLILEQLKQIYQPSFLDYLRGGLELNLSIAIDFTGSNGIPTRPQSLHYINPSRPNQYQTAIEAVARILLNYDSDKRMPCFGFGAKTALGRGVSHCFPLSLNSQELQAFGMQHLMSLYCRALTSVQFSGPTYFAPIISQAVRLAKQNAMQGSNTYQILLILTDGQIHDMDATINLLVDNCNLPLSIIIVGVGNAQFDNMIQLDGDNGLYNSKGKKAMRDIVQFVPFRDVSMNSDLLAKQLLAQLPDQVTSYMKIINKAPNPPVQLNLQSYFGSQKQISTPQQAMQNQVTNLFKQANFFSDF